MVFSGRKWKVMFLFWISVTRIYLKVYCTPQKETSFKLHWKMSHINLSQLFYIKQCVKLLCHHWLSTFLCANFLPFSIFQTSYSCLSFVDVLWPEFSIWHLYGAVLHYQRNYPSIKVTKSYYLCTTVLESQCTI